MSLVGPRCMVSHNHRQAHGPTACRATRNVRHHWAGHVGLLGLRGALGLGAGRERLIGSQVLFLGEDRARVFLTSGP